MTDDLIQRTRTRLLAQAEALHRDYISVTDLAHACRLAPSSTRQLGIPVSSTGKRQNETLYSREDVRAYLRQLNDGFEFWPEDDLLLLPRESALLLTAHGKRATPAVMAKWRERQSGPPWVRISPRAIRYRQTGLYKWLKQLQRGSQ